jgi:hypothetical protein
MIHPEKRLIVNPKSGDQWRAQDILDEIQGVLRKYGYILAHKPNCIVLAKYEEPPKPCRAIAKVRQITPNFYDWEEIDWSKIPPSTNTNSV